MRDVIPLGGRLALYAVTALLLAFLVAPILLIVPMSFSGTRYLDFPPVIWSFRWYERLFGSALWSNALVRSLQVGAITALLATPIGVLTAYAAHHARSPAVQAVRGMMLLPLLTPHIAIALGVFYLYVRLNWLGSFWGLVAAHAMLALPFVVITTLSALRSSDPAQERAALSLGCGRPTAFLRVTLPQIAPSILSGTLFAFVTSMDEVVVSLFIAAGQNTTITKVMFSSLRDELDPTIAAVSTVLTAGSLVVGLAFVALGAAKRRRRA
ncbi:ABC transporter permease (plasmid) [Roseomonas sp. CCTCC AB2023176]|uniref:ABC transporter permease n=1 Tax=Roseomonas sp. CCTCC AB2023176 TaxID=3342640 RepID=UPI0035E392D2